MSDCKCLVNALVQAPLIAKKAAAFAIWKRAVEIWTDRYRGPARWPLLADLARELREQRSVVTPAPPVPVHITRAGLEGFLVGFATAEGHFGATETGHPIFVIRLRVDDRPVLDLLSAKLQVGHIRVSGGGVSHNGRRENPQASWHVTRWPDLRCLVAVFDRCPPRGRKAGAYAVWRQLIAEATSPEGRRQLVPSLRATHRYRSGAGVRRRNRNGDRSRRVCKEALLRFAARGDAPYTSTAYERFRRSVAERDDLPTRMTVVRAFGSWWAALDACGISHVGCRAPEAVERLRSSQIVRARETREATREQIAATIRDCGRALGRWPSAMAFFRWRLRHAPRSPAQMTLYGAFEGGWAEALAYAQAGVEKRKDTGDQVPLTDRR
jgi:hypothetical protein